MKLKAIELKNFRNYEELKLDFHPNLNIFLGQNAQGKTNILEAIYLFVNAIPPTERVFLQLVPTES